MEYTAIRSRAVTSQCSLNLEGTKLANPLYFIPLLITGLSGNPELGTLASYLVSAVGQESTDDGVDRLVTMNFKNGLSHLENYELVSGSEKRAREALAARDAFISASNVEKDFLRVARAELYISSTSKLLDDPKMVISWAQKAYVNLSMAETLSWRLTDIGLGPDNPPLTFTPKYNFNNVENLYPMCDRQRDEEIAFFVARYKQGFKYKPMPWQEHILDNRDYDASAVNGTTSRNSRLREIYAYKVPLAAFLQKSGSKIKELNYPISISLNDYRLGAYAAIRLSDERCINRKSKP
jgi:hypothetical protein